MALAQMALGPHRHPVGILAQGILVEQLPGSGQRCRVRPQCLLGGHQPGQSVEKDALQPVALADHPVVVEAVEEVAPVEVHGRL